MSSYGPGMLDAQRAQLQGQQEPSAAPSVGVMAERFRQKLRVKEASETPLSRAIPADADTTTGIPLQHRVAIATRRKPSGRVNYLEEIYGKGNVWSTTPEAAPSDLFIRTWVPVNEGQATALRQMLPSDMFRQGDNGKTEVFRFLQVDPQDKTFGTDVGEIADVAVDVAQAGPAIYGAAKGAVIGGPIGGVIGGVIGDTVASVGKQAVSAALPGETDMSAGERLEAVGEDVAGGVIGEAVSYGGRRAFEAVRPQNLLRRTLSEGTDAAYRAEGETLSREFGQLTVAQETGGSTARRFESLLRQDPAAADIMLRGDIYRLQRLESNLKNQIKALGSAPSDAQLGQSIADAQLNYLEGLRDARRRAAKVLFGRARQIAGDKEVLTLNNLRDTLFELQKRASVPVSGKAASHRRIAEKAKSTWDDLYQARGIDPDTRRTKALRVTVDEFQNMMEDFGKLAAGSGQYIKDLDKASDMRVSAQILDALRRDLDANAERSDLGERLVGALKQARRGYAKMSSVLDDAKTKIVKDILKLETDKAPDEIARKILEKGWSDEQIRGVMTFLGKGQNAPLQKQVQAAAVQRLFEQAQLPGSSAVFREAAASVSPAKLAAALLKNSDKLDMIFAPEGRGVGSVMRNRLNRIQKYAGRLADTASTGPGGAQTASMMWLRQALKDTTGLVISPRAFMSQVATFMTARRLARAMADPDGQRITLDLLRLGENPKKAMSVLSRIAAWNAQESLDMGVEQVPRSAQAPELTQQDIVERTMRFAPGGI